MVLGVRALRDRSDLAAALDAAAAVTPRSTRRILREGSVVGLANPKAIVFFAAIPADSAGAVGAIAEISGVIARIDGLQATIASAVEEQTATTNEINRNVAEAAKGSAEIAENVGGVARAAASTTEGATGAQQAAGELSRMAAGLREPVGQFRH